MEAGAVVLSLLALWHLLSRLTERLTNLGTSSCFSVFLCFVSKHVQDSQSYVWKSLLRDGGMVLGYLCTSRTDVAISPEDFWRTPGIVVPQLWSYTEGIAVVTVRA